MTDTRTKLNEAQFFLGLMEKHYLEEPDFAFLLSAFVSAARSVLWVMRAEHSHVQGWQAWYDAKNAAPEEENLIDRINDLRVRTVKRATPGTNVMVELTFPRQHVTPEKEQFLSDHIGKAMTVTLFRGGTPVAPSAAPGEAPGMSIPGATLSALYRTVEEFPGEDVLAVARRYFLWLKAQVDKCEANFGA